MMIINQKQIDNRLSLNDKKLTTLNDNKLTSDDNSTINIDVSDTENENVDEAPIKLYKKRRIKNIQYLYNYLNN